MMQITLEQAKIALATLSTFLGQPAAPPAPDPVAIVSPVSVVPKLVIPDTVVTSTDRVARIAVTLSEPALRPLSWRCLTSNGTAYAPTFYKITEATIVFQPGETVKVVEVPLLRDMTGKDFKLQCPWTLNQPPVPGGEGVIRGAAAGVAATAAPIATPARAVPADPAAGRKLVFSSTFREPITPDAVQGAWRSRPEWGDVQTGNKEIAPYSHPSTQPGVTPFPIVDGYRVLRAEKVTTRSLMTGLTYDYSAAMLDSANLFTFQHGYVELRFKSGRAQGSSLAFWMLPAKGGWPPEIDIFEQGLADRDQLQFSRHWKDAAGKFAEGVILPQVVADGQWHRVGYLWTADEEILYIDGALAARRPTIFREPMKIILNVAVGGLGPAPKDARPGWKSEMMLDYLKVWQ
ncbi:family 16 glycosylhydrolase [Sphingomonas adhaesiva]|uniref:family 16 glycosylhydrolase n=1 Tax=Sphingomonas adhaesiva TaxID=28212 RepID=UPI002FF5E0AD